MRIFEEAVHHYNELPPDGGKREFGGFALLPEALTEVLEDGVVLGGGEGGELLLQLARAREREFHLGVLAALGKKPTQALGPTTLSGAADP